MQQPTKPSVAILGCGWLGLPLLKALVQAGYSVSGSSRKPETLQAIEAAGGQAYSIDLPGPIPSGFMDPGGVLIITLPPRARKLGSTAARAAMLAALASVFPQETGRPNRVLFTSSTSLYGKAEGKTTERTPVDASMSPSGPALAAVETQLIAMFSACTILRLAGLVGPGRHPGQFFGGRNRPIPNAEAPVNLVHLKDVISAIRLMLEQDKLPDGVYNVCAKAHPTKGDYYTAAAQALGLSVVGQQAGGANGKIIDSQKLRALGWKPGWDDLALDRL